MDYLHEQLTYMLPNGKKGEWKKRIGKVESDKYIFDVHWYESDSKQYDVKLKYGKEK